ncbi:uncharacterized protein LOC131629522 [Vicia villosa]|uniref:uncharacterized protein LOC131629522 n=1 Tax=Vicia villosa TaxID=3911 RepID=UPI00273C6BE6|nr:uncharacterized protein LOC131629522 [Vicia villosa]
MVHVYREVNGCANLLAKHGKEFKGGYTRFQCMPYWLVKSFDSDRKSVSHPRVEIRDNEGNKLNQLEEYEWKPLFCEICQKIGHQCNREKKAPVKQWREVKDKEKAPLPEVCTPNNPIEQASSSWTEVTKNKRAKGKIVLLEPERIDEVPCQNGYEALDGSVEAGGGDPMNKASTIRNQIGQQWSIIDNYDKHYNGIIWLMWDSSRVRVEKVSSSDQCIHVGIYNLNGTLQQWCMAVYAHNTLNLRRKMWEELENIHKITTGPWLVMGDYNNVLSVNDRLGGNKVKESEYSDLASMMDRVGLFEKESKGDHYTWSNKHSTGTIYSRIDRVIGNLDWHQDNIDFVLVIMEPSVSDHCLLKLQQKHQGHHHKYHFKFPNVVTDIEGFMQEVDKNWNQ